MGCSFRSAILASLAFSGISLALPPMRAALAQMPQNTAPAHSGSKTVPALFVSDIHFDPFHDPARVKGLAGAPASQWRHILSAAASANQRQSFESLQQSCHARGIDTPMALFDSSLKAMHARQPDARFMMVSGDLIAHGFDCRYAKLFPDAKPGDYQAFVLKTLRFVVGELRAAFPRTQVYVALGNNDSGCGDYKLDAGSDFLAETAKIVAEGLPASQRERALKEFAISGSYNVAMAEPMQGTRLIAIDDLFLSGKYSTCGGKPDPSAASAQLAWLEQQLAEARAAGEKVWVMGHIPPGIDAFSTVAKLRNVCGGQAPVSFLSSDKLADLLVKYGDVVRLGIFAHTHMDEMRLLGAEKGAAMLSMPAEGGHPVALKLVSSISPVDGNTPSFTVARVNPAAGVLADYDVVEASNQTGIDAQWSTEYNYGQTYHESQFAAENVKELIDGFKADGTAKTAKSKAYIHNYFVGDLSLELSPFWPEYVCALDHSSASAFAACVCSSAANR